MEDIICDAEAEKNVDLSGDRFTFTPDIDTLVITEALLRRASLQDSSPKIPQNSLHSRTTESAEQPQRTTTAEDNNGCNTSKTQSCINLSAIQQLNLRRKIEQSNNIRSDFGSIKNDCRGDAGKTHWKRRAYSIPQQSITKINALPKLKLETMSSSSDDDDDDEDDDEDYDNNNNEDQEKVAKMTDNDEEDDEDEDPTSTTATSHGFEGEDEFADDADADDDDDDYERDVKSKQKSKFSSTLSSKKEALKTKIKTSTTTAKKAIKKTRSLSPLSSSSSSSSSRSSSRHSLSSKNLSTIKSARANFAYRRTTAHQLINCRAANFVAFNNNNNNQMTTTTTTTASTIATPTEAKTQVEKRKSRNSKTEMFAVAADCGVTIFESYPDGQIKAIAKHTIQNECIHVCAWTSCNDPTKIVTSESSKNVSIPVLLFGGRGGKLYKRYSPQIDHDEDDDCNGCDNRKTAIMSTQNGSLGSILDLKIDPRRSSIAFVAHTDATIRMWNVDREILLAIFGGIESENGVNVSIDLNPNYDFLLAATGVDAQISIWNYSTHVSEMKCNEKSEEKTTVPQVYRSNYRTNTNFGDENDRIECIAWWQADCIISKLSHSEKFRIWHSPLLSQAMKQTAETIIDTRKTDNSSFVDSHQNLNDFVEIATFDTTDANEADDKNNPHPVSSSHSTRFDLSADKSRLAIGDARGDVRVWNLALISPNRNPFRSNFSIRKISIRKSGCQGAKSSVRDAAFSAAAKSLVTVHDGGVVVRYDLRNGNHFEVRE